MRAARFSEYGGAIQVDEIPIPVPGPGEVLIKVAATSFNPSEAALRSGWLREVLPVTLPYTLGWDMAGTIVQVDPAATRWSAGEHVIGRLDAGGAAAEYVIAPVEVLAAAPTSIPLAEAAAIPVAGLTAWQALFEHAGVRAGQRVLINGAGGGVGGWAVQLAKHAGAKVIATASPRSAAAVGALGADQIVDYTAEELPDGVDAVINLAAISPDAAAALARLSDIAVSIATPIPGHPHFVARNDPAQLDQLVALVDSGKLRVPVAETHRLADVQAIHDRSAAGQIRGKIIILAWETPEFRTAAG